MRDENSGWIQLHSAEFFLLWSVAGFGEVPVALGIGHVGRTPGRRAELIAQADESLAARELGTVAVPARDLAGYLRALAEPELAVDLHAEGRGPELRAMSSVGAEGSAAAAVVGSEVRVGPVSPDGTVPALLEALPAVPPGPGRGANVRWVDYRRACTEGQRDGTPGFVEALRDAGLRAPEANTVMRAISGRVGGGQLGAGTRTPRGWARASDTVNWVDTEEGRYAVRRGGEWVMVTPVDVPQLVAMADEMVADLR
ncbi:MAG: ESX secretion-associated protein EspG [Pseudonocardiaceae bacterium]|nr:ESX secretion-associated protein EspG [Pseudonocardiaceae bacterium]